MNSRLIPLMEKYRKGSRSAFHLGPFLPLTRIRDRGLPFNTIMKEHEAMTEAALMSFEFGFESTVLPFDLNVEAEILGAEVRYHDAVDGNPVYPTIGEKPFSVNGPIRIPHDLSKKGRMPAILASIRSIKEQMQDKGAVGIFLPGQFTLAGQVMDMDALFLMILKQPEKIRKIFQELTLFIHKLIDVYVHAGVDFMNIVEGGGASISPAMFSKLLLPFLRDLFRERKIPMVVYHSGSSEKILKDILTCGPDGIFLDREDDIQKTVALLPEGMPLFSGCGRYDMLANATQGEVIKRVHGYLDMGLTTVGLPADIYPPAKNENIKAFVKALKEYEL